MFIGILIIGIFLEFVFKIRGCILRFLGFNREDGRKRLVVMGVGIVV